jgi:co-chaperonin GroES (HSP10)
MRLVAVNDVMMVIKDHVEYKSAGGIILPEQLKSENMMEIPPPYTGTIDSIGVPNDEYQVGDHIAFCDMGGLYIKVDDIEYVVISKEMVIGKI